MDEKTAIDLAQMALGLHTHGVIGGDETLIRTTWPKASKAMREAWEMGYRAAAAEREEVLRETAVMGRRLMRQGEAYKPEFIAWLERKGWKPDILRRDTALAAPEPEEPRCPTCGGDQWLTERAPQVGVEPIIGSRTIPCPACRPRYVQPPTHDAASALLRHHPWNGLGAHDAAYEEAVRRLEAPTTRPEPEPTCHTCGHIESAHLHEIHEGARWCDIHECPCPNYACQPQGEGSET